MCKLSICKVCGQLQDVRDIGKTGTCSWCEKNEDERVPNVKGKLSKKDKK
jgi:hypothetical protein